MAKSVHHTNWFGHCQTVAEVKAEYRRLCFMYHPDQGGDSDIMQHINHAYRLALHRSDLPTAPTHTSTRMESRRHASPAPATTVPPTEWTRDALRRLWEQSCWQQVAAHQYQRRVGTHLVVLVRWTVQHDTMWAVQAAGEFSKYAFLTRSEAEEEGFNLLVRRLVGPDA